MTPGTRLDRYIVERRVAPGVYRVRHETLDTPRALKLGSDREGRLQAALDHPNLVRIVDVIEVDGDPALVLEWVEGPTLGQLLRDAPPRLEDALRLFRDVLDGVAHAHQHGLIHRDLTPANILLDVSHSPPIARVTDFGAARETDERGPREGTPGYAAPEQLRGADVQASADVFALGVLLFELCAGALPYPQVDREQLLGAMEREERVPAALPEGVDHVVDACLCAGPRDRPLDARALRSALDAPPPSPPIRAPLGAVLALAAVAVGLGAWAWSLKGDRDDARQQTEAAELMYEAARVREDDPATALALLRAVAHLRGEDRVPDREAAVLLDAGAATLRLDQPGALTVRVDLSDGLVALADDRPGVRVLRRDTGETVVDVESGILRPVRLRLDAQERWFVLTAPGDPAEAVSPVAAWSLPDGAPLVTAASTPAWARAASGAFDTVLIVFEQISGTRRAELRTLPDGELVMERELPSGQVANITEHGVLVPTGEAWVLVDRDGERGSWETAPNLSPTGQAWALRGDGVGMTVHDADGQIASIREATGRLAWSSDGSHFGGVDGDERLHAARLSDGAVFAWPSEVSARAVAGTPGGFLVGTSQGQVHSWLPGGSDRIHRGLRSRVLSMVEHDGAIAGSDLEGRAALWDDRHPGTMSRAPSAAPWWDPVHVQDGRVVGPDLDVPLPESLHQLLRGVVRLDGATLVASSNEIVLLDDQGQVLRSEPLSQIGRVVASGDHALVVHGATARFSEVGADGTLVRTAHATSDQAISAIVPGASVHAGTFCGRLLRFDGSDPTELASIGSPISALAVSDAGVAAGTWDGRVLLVDDTGVAWTWTLGRQIVDLAWTPTGLVAADEDGLLSWLSPDGALLAARRGHDRGKVRLHADGGLWSWGAGVGIEWDAARVAAEPPTLERTGAWSNLRVCRHSGQVVPVLPWPDPETVWAPTAACE